MEFTRKTYQRNDEVAGIGIVQNDVLTAELWDKESKSVVCKAFRLNGSAPQGEVFFLGRADGDVLTVAAAKAVPQDDATVYLVQKDGLCLYSSTKYRTFENKTSAAGKAYQKVKFSGGDNKTISINAFDFKAPEEGGRVTFVLDKEMDKRESDFKKGGESVQWTTWYGMGKARLA